MTDLAKDFRAQLAERAAISTPEIVSVHKSADDTCNGVLRADSFAGVRNGVHPRDRSGDVGASLHRLDAPWICSFCSTAQQGFNRNLTTAEIVGQVWLAKRELAEFDASKQPGGDRRIVTNVVLMGMGEPLANFRNVVPALRVLLDDYGFDLSRRRVTLSTSGLVPQIYKLPRKPTLRSPCRCMLRTTSCARARADQPQASDCRAARGMLGTTIDEQNGRSVTVRIRHVGWRQ